MAITTLSNPDLLIKESIRKVTAIATLPEITTHIIKTVEDPRSTAQQLHKIVSHDPALASRILKVVNSAFYGLPGQISTIERAIVLLGLNAVKNIAVAASLGQMFRGGKLTEKFTPRDLWTHCIAVAVMARSLARELKLPSADEAFLGGMVHDIGILVNLQVDPMTLRAVCANAAAQPSDFCQLERDALGIDHQQLGRGLAEQWRFPRACQLIAGGHHDPGTIDEASRQLVTLIYIADTVCCQKGYGFDLTARAQTVEEPMLAAAALTPAHMDRAIAATEKSLQDAVSMLGG